MKLFLGFSLSGQTAATSSSTSQQHSSENTGMDSNNSSNSDTTANPSERNRRLRDDVEFDFD
jgi:hypothetical protein